jgi:hypothetical protein
LAIGNGSSWKLPGSAVEFQDSYFEIISDDAVPGELKLDEFKLVVDRVEVAAGLVGLAQGKAFRSLGHESPRLSRVEFRFKVHHLKKPLVGVFLEKTSNASPAS